MGFHIFTGETYLFCLLPGKLEIVLKYNTLQDNSRKDKIKEDYKGVKIKNINNRS